MSESNFVARNITNKFNKFSERILKKQAENEKLPPNVCLRCNRIVKDTKLIMTGKTFNELCEDMCTKFDIHSAKMITPEIKKAMEKYLEEQQTKYCKPAYVCNSCALKCKQ